MVSSKRRRKAKQQGMEAAIATNCNPTLTRNPYTMGSIQAGAFDDGWNYVRKRFKFLRKIK